MEGEEQIVPVFQALRARHDTVGILLMVHTFLKLTGVIPNEVACDFSLALLNGVCLAYNECRLDTYISKCYKWIIGKKLEQPLQCYLRLDIAHLIKMICRKKIFIGKQHMIKDFYVRAIAVMTTCDTLASFENFLTNIIIVALSECDGQDELGFDTICQKSENFLFTAIKSFSHQGDEQMKFMNSEEKVDASESNNENHQVGEIFEAWLWQF